MIKEKRSFTEGPLFFRIILFTLPILATGVLQVLYNMADSIIVGKFSGDPNALAAVGSVSAVNALIVNFAIGIAVGAGIVIAQLFGAKRYDEGSRAAHTAMTFSVYAGIVTAIVGFAVAPYALELMKIKEEIISQSELYMRVLMLGVPALSVYNFGASILRSVGDSKTPLIILSCSGLMNVLLNLLFVIGFGMTVDGVALATVISQYASAIAIVYILVKRKDECYSICIKNLRIHSNLLKRMLRIGVPTGFQSAMFNLANSFIMSAVNTFPTAVVSGYAIAANIEAVTYTSMNCFQQASMTFTGQNYGAGKNDRVKRVLAYSMIQVIFVGVLISQIELLFGESLASLYISADDPNRAAVIEATMEIMRIMLATYFLCGMMEVLSGALRGIGCSIVPMIVSLVGACVLRLIWIYAIFFPSESLSTITHLLLAFPISWVITVTAHFITVLIMWKKKKILGKSKQIS